MPDPRVQPAPGVGPAVSPQSGMAIPLVALADPNGNLGAPVQVLSAVSTGTSPAVDLGSVKANPVMVVESAGGSFAGGVVQLQGSLSNADPSKSWYPIASTPALSGSVATVVSASNETGLAGVIIPARYVRAVITSNIVSSLANIWVGGA